MAGKRLEQGVAGNPFKVDVEAFTITCGGAIESAASDPDEDRAQCIECIFETAVGEAAGREQRTCLILW